MDRYRLLQRRSTSVGVAPGSAATSPAAPLPPSGTSRNTWQRSYCTRSDALSSKYTCPGLVHSIRPVAHTASCRHTHTAPTAQSLTLSLTATCLTTSTRAHIHTVRMSRHNSYHGRAPVQSWEHGGEACQRRSNPRLDLYEGRRALLLFLLLVLLFLILAFVLVSTTPTRRCL